MRRTVIAGLVMVVLAAAVGVAVDVTVSHFSNERPTAKGPNIVVIMTDDQTLQEMKYLPVVNDLIGKTGTTFTNYAVSFPNCCPSRATYLTGQYAHNTGVEDNVPPDGGFKKLRGKETLPVWLDKAGYDTASIGKYLNTWGDGGQIQAPPGWRYWYSLIDPSTYNYFDFDVSVNGVRTHFGTKPQDYSTDVLARAAVKYIGDRAAKHDTRPFFLSFTPLAPHVQAQEQGNAGNLEAHFAYPVPAPRYKGTLPYLQPPRTASYDQKDVSKLPKDVQRSPMVARDAAFIRKYYEAEVETVLAVNDAVKGIVGALKKAGDLSHTVILFTSDNGLFHGEHRLRSGKYYLYEPAAHLPLLVTGGPFSHGGTVAQQASNVDLTPTILALTGVKAHGLVPDGRSLIPFVGHPTYDTGRGVLLENFRQAGVFHTWGIRTPDWKYLVDVQGEKELYHLTTDPDETTNLAGDPRYTKIQASLAARANALELCAGATCEDSDASRAKPTH